VTYAILTPKYGYDNILIFLGGISDVSTKYFDFFKSKNTFVPRGTKIYFLSGQLREMQFMIDYHRDNTPVPGWFNIDKDAKLRPTEHDFTQARESLQLVLDEIDRIKTIENVDYKNIYLSGFSQGGMMTNYVLLNSRHQLGGYIAFSGYVFDHDFSKNTIIYKNDMTDTQKSKLQSRKDYHILATHSFMDNAVFYQLSAESYRVYYSDYTDFKLLSFAALPHVLREQPVHPFVKKWLKESMGK
jgi:phospholipase/carboxylesterase